MSKKITILLLAFMLTACSNASISDSQAETEALSETTTTTVTTTDDSEQPTTTTTPITVTSAKEKETETTTSKVTSGSTTGTSESTAAASTTAGASVAATKATTKATVKQTIKATTKVTTKATTKATQTTTDLSKLTPYWRALYNMTLGNTTKQDCELVRNELLAYGKKLYPQFAINTKLHPLITKDGKYTDSFTEAEGGTNSDTEYYTVTPYGDVGLYYPYKSETERWNTMKWFDTSMKTVIKNTLQDSTRFDASQTVWYISYGFENKGGGVGTYSWVCMTAFPDDWK